MLCICLIPRFVMHAITNNNPQASPYNERMRTFIAIEIPSNLKDELAAAARSLQSRIKGRFTSRENYHITLAFLGDSSQAMLDCAQEAMDFAVSQIDGTPDIELRPDGLGSFGRPKNATLWMGFAKQPELMQLAEDLRNRLHHHGFDTNEKSFLPHVTLARHACLPRGSLASIPFPDTCKAHRLTLFKSELHRDGAIYEPLYSIDL